MTQGIAPSCSSPAGEQITVAPIVRATVLELMVVAAVQTLCPASADQADE